MDFGHPGGTRPVIAVTPEAKEEAKRLCERGLSLYGRGRLEEAARMWLAARAADPAHPRVQRYLDHVREADGLALDGLKPADQALLASTEEPMPPPRPNLEPDYIPNPPLDPSAPGAPSFASTKSTGQVTRPIPRRRKPPTGPVRVDPMPAPPSPALEAQYAPRPPQTTESPELLAAVLRMREAQGADDFTGAIEAAERVLALVSDHPEAVSVLTRAKERLLLHLESKIGDLRSVPALRIPADEVIWLNLNHREGFILSQIDGTLTFEDVLDVCGMPRLEALRVLANLVADKVISAHPIEGRSQTS